MNDDLYDGVMCCDTVLVTNVAAEHAASIFGVGFLPLTCAYCTV
jgi:hypothetical protein